MPNVHNSVHRPVPRCRRLDRRAFGDLGSKDWLEGRSSWASWFHPLSCSFPASVAPAVTPTYSFGNQSRSCAPRIVRADGPATRVAKSMLNQTLREGKSLASVLDICTGNSWPL